MSLTIAVNGKSEQVSYTAPTAILEGGKNVATSIEIFKGTGAATPAKSK